MSHIVPQQQATTSMPMMESKSVLSAPLQGTDAWGNGRVAKRAATQRPRTAGYASLPISTTPATRRPTTTHLMPPPPQPKVSPPPPPRKSMPLLGTQTGVVYGEEIASLVIQPNDKSIVKQVGASLALTCRPNVQDPHLVTQLEWRDIRGKKIGNENRAAPIYVQVLPGGEPGSVLIFSSLTENMAGEYSCHASYANTEKIQASVNVTTYLDIDFIDAPESQYPVVGKDYTIKCKVQGNPAPMIDWNKDDQSILTSQKYVVLNDELIIKNVSESDDGVYRCTAVVPMTGRIKNRNIKVEVQVPPKISPSAPVSIIEGETASISCSAIGKPPPTFKWIKERAREDLATTDRFDVKKNTGELIVNRVEFNDDGLYKCVAENPAGRDEATVKINVLVKPKIYELLNVTAPINTETKLICKTQGRPPPNAVFRKLSRKEPFYVGQQKDNRRITLEQQVFEEKGETFATLIITKLNRTDDGLYECIADNKAGTAYKNGHIAVEFPPTFERTKDLPPFYSWEGKPGNLTCLPEAIPNATIVWKYNGIEIEDSSVFKKIGNGPQSFLIVNPQHERRYYTNYECIATNKLGQDTLKIRLNEGKVPGHVAQVTRQSVTATTIKFNIIPPNTFDTLPIKAYTVQYRPEREISWDYAKNHTWAYGAPYILEGLHPERTYHFRFAAKNEVGLGPWYNAESVTMPRRSEPAEPKILMQGHNDENSSNREEYMAVSPYADHYELRWSVPSDNGDPIQHYLIRYCVTEKVNGEWRDSDCSEEIQQSVQYTTYQLDGLHAATVYKIELRAHNAIGDSSPAQIRVRTAQGSDPVIPMDTPAMSSATIIGIVVAAIFLVLIVVDITCFCVNRAGIIALLCDRSKSKHHDEEDPKLGREEHEPLKPESPVNGEKQLSVEYDGKQILSKTGVITGKHSAV